MAHVELGKLRDAQDGPGCGGSWVSDDPKVFVSGPGGATPIRLDNLLATLEREASEREDVRRKLVESGAPDRYVFLLDRLARLRRVGMLCSGEPPSRGLSLPPEITAIWVAGRCFDSAKSFGSSVLAWAGPTSPAPTPRLRRASVPPWTWTTPSFSFGT
jgi:hypothetical protein